MCPINVALPRQGWMSKLHLVRLKLIKTGIAYKGLYGCE